MLVMPSDHVIRDVERWRDAVAAAAPAALGGAIVTFGMKPHSPNTGYGYIRARAADHDDVVRGIEQFIEKPDLSTARDLLRSGDCYWNSGMFLMRPSVFTNELERLAPLIATATSKSMRTLARDGLFVRPGKSAFLETPSDSIDYAVMERTDRARVMPADFGWSDVGSWEAVREVVPQDADGNVVRGDVFAIDVRDSLVRCETDMTVALVGLSEIVCIITDDAAFIAPLSRAQDNKKVVELLRASGHPRADQPARVYRPWGTYQTMDRGDRFQTRRLIVKPGAQQSLQVHRKRSEHFIIVSGSAQIDVAGETKRLEENQSIFVAPGVSHRIRNPGSEPLHIIEVQCGSHLGEDDIERIEDAYGRS
jgi:mannose-1-phosphate guanylyltransferase/mannose-6-phosphate isomerase